MSASLLKRLLIVFVVVLVATSSYFCNSPSVADKGEQPRSPWRNVYDTTAHYVGMDACKGCHADVYNTFMKTGMGQSFDLATHAKSAADFSPQHALVYDTALDFYYKPYWENDSLSILEFRVENGDTVHKLLHRVNYIVGSGQHTNSHMFNINGYLYQAPITFYTQQQKWDLAPGFEKGANTRFQRLIELECMSCHNGYPDFVAGSENKFTAVKRGIDCERCHGPGSIHVQERGNQPIVDTSKGPDYSIVNPRRLPTELQNNVCQRCHLQGITVLSDGKSFFDFKPGMHLSEVMNVFMPKYAGAKDKMIMASHVERMKKSNCYVLSNKMSCITCHNPHVSVKYTPRSQYLNACAGCHSAKGQSLCTEKESVRAQQNNDCVTCHMPRNGSIDIPHVAVTDHYIRKRPAKDTIEKKITAFLGMQCFNNDHVDAITKARGFLEFYERYTPAPGLLDSAITYLDQAQEIEKTTKQNRDYIRAYYLMHQYTKVTGYAATMKPAEVSDAWTCYRIAAAYMETDDAATAKNWYMRATTIWPFSLDFQNKYGVCLLALNQNAAAKKVFEYILSENGTHASALTNIGFIYMQEGNSAMAYHYFMRANEQNPDYEQNLINLAVWCHNNNRDNETAKHLLHLLQKHPENEQARAMLADLKGTQ